MNVAEPTAAAATGVAAISSAAVRFIGDRRSYWRLLLRGAVLLAVTLGIYRFWLATDIRRFLWSNTEVAGETLEYTGTPFELLIGFLIAIALLVPLYVVFGLAALSAGTWGQIISVLGFPMLFFLGQFAVYRARRYRLTRTVFRGVRCHQSGSAIRYAVCAVFWWVLIVLSLGLAYPFAQSRLERFKMRNTFYGDLKGRFEGSGFRLFLRGFPMWLLVVGPFAGAIAFSILIVDWHQVAAAAEAASNMDEFAGQLEHAFPGVYAAVVVTAAAFCLSIIMAVVLFPVFQAMVLRWWIGGLRFGPLAIHSHLRTGTIYAAYLRFLGYGLLFLIALAVLAGVGAFLLGIAIGGIANPLAAEAFSALTGLGLYVMVMLGFSAIYQATVKLAFWSSGAESMTFENFGVLDSVKAEGAASSSVGEGLADALNVGGI